VTTDPEAATPGNPPARKGGTAARGNAAASLVATNPRADCGLDFIHSRPAGTEAGHVDR